MIYLSSLIKKITQRFSKIRDFRFYRRPIRFFFRVFLMIRGFHLIFFRTQNCNLSTFCNRSSMPQTLPIKVISRFLILTVEYLKAPVLLSEQRPCSLRRFKVLSLIQMTFYACCSFLTFSSHFRISVIGICRRYPPKNLITRFCNCTFIRLKMRLNLRYSHQQLDIILPCKFYRNKSIL